MVYRRETYTLYIYRLNTIRPTITQGAFRGFEWSQIQKSWEAFKRLDRLSPNLVHVCGFVWEWTYHDDILNKCLKRAARVILQCTF